MASIWDVWKSTITNPLGTFRTGGTAREYWKSVIPYETRYAITGGQGIKRAFAAENERQTTAKYNSPIYGPYFGGGGQAPTAPAPNSPGVSPLDTSISGTELQALYGGGSGGGSTAAELQAYQRKMEELQAYQRKMEELQRARDSYLRRYAEQEKFRQTAKDYATDQYNTAVSRANEKRSELSSDYSRERQNMQDALAATMQGLVGAYSSRGLGDSSFSLKAQANAQKEFDRNLSYLNEDEARQYKEIDQYLESLKKQREYNLAELRLEDFNSVEDYNDAIAKFDTERKNIEAQQELLRASVASAASSIGGMSMTDATMKFYNDIGNILNTAMPSENKKKLLSNIFYQMGKKDPDRQADYYLSWKDALSAIENGQETPESANSFFQEKFGVTPF